MKQKIKNVLREKLKFLNMIRKKYLIYRFKKKYQTVRVFENPSATKYSQENQDMIVYDSFFRNKKNGIFCDVGGNHPLNFNNTRYFEEVGWSGYVFEPLPEMKLLWDKSRNATFFPFAVSDCEGDVIFSIVSDKIQFGDMNSFLKDTKDSRYNYESVDITVKTRLIKNVFNENNIKHIDYMSIDVEGHELNVIKGIDFSRVRINVLTIENNSTSCPIYGDDKIRKIMFDNGYIFWGRIIGLDDIFIHKDFIN